MQAACHSPEAAQPANAHALLQRLARPCPLLGGPCTSSHELCCDASPPPAPAVTLHLQHFSEELGSPLSPLHNHPRLGHPQLQSLPGRSPHPGLGPVDEATNHPR